MKTLRIQLNAYRRFLRDERAATAIEYAMIAGGIAVAIVAAVNSLGVTVLDMYQTIKNAMGA
ncbi:MAG: Flp family type IVb pilin [Pseudorhodoplanes sp.]